MCLPCACQLSLDICWEHKALAQVNPRSDPVQRLLLCLKESIIFPDIQFVLLPLPRFVSITQSCQHVCGFVVFFFPNVKNFSSCGLRSPLAISFQ